MGEPAERFADANIIYKGPTTVLPTPAVLRGEEFIEEIIIPLNGEGPGIPYRILEGYVAPAPDAVPAGWHDDQHLVPVGGQPIDLHRVVEQLQGRNIPEIVFRRMYRAPEIAVNLNDLPMGEVADMVQMRTLLKAVAYKLGKFAYDRIAIHPAVLEGGGRMAAGADAAGIGYQLVAFTKDVAVGFFF